MATLSDKAGFLIAANFVKYAVGFIMPMLLVRMLTKSDYGTLQQIQLVGNVCLGVMVLGLPSSVYYFYRHDRLDERVALMLQTSWMLFASGLFTLIVLQFAGPFLASQANNPAIAVFLPVFAISVGLNIAAEHFVPFMIAQDRYTSAVVFETTEAIVRVAMLVIPLLAGAGLPGLIWAIVGVALARFLVRKYWLLRAFDWKLRPAKNSYFVGEQMKYSLPMFATALVGLLGGEFDRILIATNFTPAQYAVYIVGALSIPLDTIFQSAVSNVLRASLPALVRKRDHEEILRLLREAVRKLSIIVLPTFVFLYGFSQDFIVLLFTENYSESVTVFRIYLLMVPLHMLVLSPTPQAFDKTRISMYLVVGITILHGAASYALLKWIGYLGPAWSNILCSYLLSVLYALLVSRLLGTSPLKLFPLAALARVTASALLALAVSWFVFHTGTRMSLLMLAGSGITFTVMFGLFALLLGVFTPQDRALARRWMQKFGLVQT